MAHMIRKQIYILKRQQILLRRLAQVGGVSEAEIVRRAIDQQVNAGVDKPVPRDPEALEAVIQFALARRQHSSTGQPYRWRREDAYEERLSRYGRRLSS